MTISITHGSVPIEVVIDKDFILPPPVAEEARLPSQTPIFDKLMREFFADRDDNYDELVAKYSIPKPVFNFGSRPVEPVTKSIPKPRVGIGPVDGIPVAAIQRIYKLEPDTQE